MTDTELSPEQIDLFNSTVNAQPEIKDTNTNIEQVLLKINELKAKKDQLDAQIKLLEAPIRAAVAEIAMTQPDGEPIYGEFSAGRAFVSVTRNARIDDRLARDLLTESEYERASVRKIDSKLAKKILSGEDYEAIQRVSVNGTVKIGLVD